MTPQRGGQTENLGEKKTNSYLFVDIELHVRMVAGHDGRVEPSIVGTSSEGIISPARAPDGDPRVSLRQKQSSTGKCQRRRWVSAAEDDEGWEGMRLAVEDV